MSQFNTFYDRPFLACLDLLKDESFLIQFAATLEKRSHMRPRFVNVEKTIVASKISELWTKNLHVKSALQAYEAEKILVNEQKLRKLVLESVGKEWDTACYLGDPGESLLLDADSSESRFMVLGIDRQKGSPWTMRFSTLFYVLSRSFIPVFIIPENYDCRNWLEGKLKFLLADDLNEKGSPIVDTTFRMAASLERTEILHLHVNSLTLGQLEETISTGLDPSLLMENKSINTVELYNLMQKSLEKQLQNRAMPYVKWAEQANVEYRYTVEIGDPKEEINAKIEEFKPDLVIFGKHSLVHAQPFYLGHVPFHAMTKHSVPVLIVP